MNPYYPERSSGPYSCMSTGTHSTSQPQPQPFTPVTAEESTPFNLCFIAGNISKCAGCGNKHAKPVVSLHDLCIQHHLSLPLVVVHSSLNLPLHTIMSICRVLVEIGSTFSHGSWSYHGNISKCAGCGYKHTKPVVSLHDLCIQHPEWQSFTASGGGAQQSKFAPAYYHVNLPCVRRNWINFQPWELVISPKVSSKLSPVHNKHLASLGFFVS